MSLNSLSSLFSLNSLFSLSFLTSLHYPQKKERSTWNTPLLLHYFSTLSAKFHQQHVDIRGRHSRDSTRLTYRCRPNSRQLLACLNSQRLQRPIVKLRRYSDALQSMHLIGVLLLPLDIASVLNLYLCLLQHLPLEALICDILLEAFRYFS